MKNKNYSWFEFLNPKLVIIPSIMMSEILREIIDNQIFFMKLSFQHTISFGGKIRIIRKFL